VSYTIIQIPTKSSSNEINSFVVIFVPHQLTLGHVVGRRQDHVRLLYDIPNVTTLVRKIIVNLVLSVTEILTIKDHKFYDTFLHIAFGLQNLLELITDQTASDTN
jgi:hypothetical protein